MTFNSFIPSVASLHLPEGSKGSVALWDGRFNRAMSGFMGTSSTATASLNSSRTSMNFAPLRSPFPSGARLFVHPRQLVIRWNEITHYPSWYD